MRRIILLALVVVLCFFGYTCITEGVINDNFNVNISEFEKVEENSEKMTKELAAYNEKNDKEFEVAKSNLSTAIKSYENTKKEYKDLIDALGIQDNSAEEENIIESTKKAYQIDFLLATIGNYATKEGIQDLDLVFVESTNAKAPANAGYVLADLKFTVTADYILIANFLYDLEDDDRLAYEIKDYHMVRDKADFTVYNVPIESSTLTEITSSQNNVSDGNISNENINSNTVNNTSTNTISNNTTNTTNTVGTRGNTSNTNTTNGVN